jgi:hypothetical protein
VDLTGSVRELAVAGRDTDVDRFLRGFTSDAACLSAASFARCAAWDALNEQSAFTSLTRVRTQLDLRATEQLSAVLVYDHEISAGTLDTLGRSIGSGLESDTLLRADQTLVSGQHVRWRHLLYRGYLAFESRRLELTAGRQRIPWGVGRLWNPIDRFNPIGPLALEGDQSPGVDAAAARWNVDGFTFAEVVFAPLRDLDDGSYAARWHGTARNVDYSLVAGLFRDALTFGFDLDRNLGDAAVRLEVVWADPDRRVQPVGQAQPRELDPFWQVVASIDYLFDVGSGLYVLAEHLYNGNALGFGDGKAGPLLGFFEQTPAGGVRPTDLDRFGGSGVISFSENQTGLQAGYDLMPELRGELLGIYDWNGRSGAVVPSLRYSPLGWLELTLGGQIFAGPDRSQFGSLEPLGFLLAEVFF